MPNLQLRHPRNLIAGALAILLCLAVGLSVARLFAASVPVPANPTVRLLTTPAVLDSGLLDALLPPFERQTGYHVERSSATSARAIELAKQGAADLLLVHPLYDKQVLIQSGIGIESRLVMHDDLVLAGSPTDPAHVSGKPILTALKGISSSGSTFVSRRDASDTNRIELQLWTATLHRDAQHEGWYVSTHSDMTTTLAEAAKRRAYTLSDRATFLSWSNSTGTHQLKILVENDQLLSAPYEAIRINPQKAPDTNTQGASALTDYLLSPSAQQIISTYGTRQYTQPIFTPAENATTH